MAADNFGTVFGDRHIGRQIGSGTDGRVFFLRPKDNEKDSVVKIIKLSHEKILDTKDNTNPVLFSYSDKEYCDAFIKNITDNIDLVRSYDSGKYFADYYEWEKRPSSDESSDMLLIRMEKLTPLSDFLGEYSFTQEEVLRLAICLCSSLDKCRDFGFIYPNLKPENVMFDSIGKCKVGDLGTFCCLPPVKNSIAFRHTQQYMAPEFYKTDVINDTCDTYSLGLVMYALLNKGRLPFLPTYPAEITMNDIAKSLNRRVNGEEIPAPKMADADVSALVLKAISYEPKNRYRTPRHMLSDIRKLLNGEEVIFEDNDTEPVCTAESANIPEYIPDVSKKHNDTEDDRENVFDDYFDKEYGLQEFSDKSERKDIKPTESFRTKDSSYIKSYKSLNLNKHQKMVLLLLAVALALLVLTVIVLSVKFSINANSGTSPMSITNYIQMLIYKYPSL